MFTARQLSNLKIVLEKAIQNTLFPNSVEVFIKPKSIVTYKHTFYHTLQQLQLFALSFDWFTELSMYVVCVWPVGSGSLSEHLHLLVLVLQCSNKNPSAMESDFLNLQWK